MATEKQLRYWASMKGKHKINSGQFKPGTTPWNTGGIGLVKYNSLHRWLQRNFKKTGICESCHLSSSTEWASKNGGYTRNRDSYVELCISCHRYMDRAKPKRPDWQEGVILYG